MQEDDKGMKKYIIKTLLTNIVFVALSLAPLSVQAQETSASFGGSVKVGNDTTGCTGTNEGSIRYNTTSDNLEYCDGVDWQAGTKNTGITGITLCAGVASVNDVGDTCTDGSVYAGLNFIPGTGYVALYVTDIDQTSATVGETEVYWTNLVTATNDIDPNDYWDGQANSDNIITTITDHPALDLCENLTRHTHSDWYLPSIMELTVIFQNRNEINAGSIEAFQSDNYWSSSEYLSSIHRLVFQPSGTFGPGAGNVPAKRSAQIGVRCARRD